MVDKCTFISRATALNICVVYVFIQCNFQTDCCKRRPEDFKIFVYFLAIVPIKVKFKANIDLHQHG